MKPKKYDIPTRWRVESISDLTFDLLLSIIFIFLGLLLLFLWAVLSDQFYIAKLFAVGSAITFILAFAITFWDICQHPREGSIDYELGPYKVKLMDMDYFVPPDKLKVLIKSEVEEPFEEYLDESVRDILSGSITILLAEDSHENMVTTFGSTDDQIVVCDSSCMIETELFDLITIAICNILYPYKVTKKGNATENIEWLKQRGLVDKDMEASCLKA